MFWAVEGRLPLTWLNCWIATKSAIHTVNIMCVLDYKYVLQQYYKKQVSGICPLDIQQVFELDEVFVKLNVTDDRFINSATNK